MKELLQKWEEYKKVWYQSPQSDTGLDDIPGKWKPTFEGFMEWLKNEKSSD